MQSGSKNKASVYIIVIFVIAMLATITMGILQMNTQELNLVRHRIYAAQALALAEGGLNMAMAEIRNDSTWTSETLDITGLVGSSEWWTTLETHGTSFGDGFYATSYDGNDVTITAGVDSWRGYTSKIEAQVTVTSTAPHIIRINNYKVNEQ